MSLTASEEKTFKVFPILSLWELMTPRGKANLDPRGMVGRICVGDHQTYLHTLSVSSGPHAFREEDFLMFFGYIALYKQMTPPGVWPVWSP